MVYSCRSIVISFLFLFLIVIPIVNAGIEIGGLNEEDTVINLLTPESVLSTLFGNLTNFTELLDTPAAFTGSGGDCVAVNVGETALEFIACAAAGGVSSATANATYYKLDTSNNPLTGDVLIRSTEDTIDINFTTDGDYGIIRYVEALDFIGIYNALFLIWENLYVVGNTSILGYLSTEGNISAGGIICDSVGCIGSGGNESWNESMADDRYVNIDGDVMEGNLSIGGQEIVNISYLRTYGLMGDAGYLSYIASLVATSSLVFFSGDVGVTSTTLTLYGDQGLEYDSAGASLPFFPNDDNYNDIGTAAKRWRNAFLGGNLTVNNITVVNISASGIICDSTGCIGSGITDTNATTECGDGEYLDGGGWCADVNTTIDTRTNSTTYLPFNVTVLAGTHDWGNETSLWVSRDGYYLNVSESIGADPLTIVINWTGVNSFDFIDMRGRYDGGLGHEIEIGVWDFDAGDYEEEYVEITDQPDFEFSFVHIRDPSVHVSGGEVSVRIRHVQNGNPGHNYFLDYIVLVEGFSTASNIDHDGLSGRDDPDNHPWALPRDGSKNMTGDLLGDLGINATFDRLFINDQEIGGTVINYTHDTTEDVCFHYAGSDNKTAPVMCWDGAGETMDFFESIVVAITKSITIGSLTFSSSGLSATSGGISILTSDAVDQGVTIQNMLECNANVGDCEFKGFPVSNLGSPTTDFDDKGNLDMIGANLTAENGTFTGEVFVDGEARIGNLTVTDIIRATNWSNLTTSPNTWTGSNRFTQTLFIDGIIQHYGDGNTYFGFFTDRISQYAGGVEFLRFDENGGDYFLIDPSATGVLTGIGTATPTSTLEVNGNVKADCYENEDIILEWSDNGAPTIGGYVTYEATIEQDADYGYWVQKNMTVHSVIMTSGLNVSCSVIPHYEFRINTVNKATININGTQYFLNNTFTPFDVNQGDIAHIYSSSWACGIGGVTVDDAVFHVYATRRCP